MKQHVEIVYNDIEKNENYAKIITKVVEECFKNENMDGLKLYISITLTTPKDIKELNKKYRNIDKETDVLSFPIFEKEELQNLIKAKYDIDDCIGDVIISIDKVNK